MKKTTSSFWLVLLFVCIAGFILAKIDTSSNWDDTAITAILVLVTSFLAGATMPKLAWLWAIIIGGVIFSFNVLQSNNYSSAAATLFAFTGAYAGVLFKKLMSNTKVPS